MEPSVDLLALVQEYLSARESGSLDAEPFELRAGDRRADFAELRGLVDDLEGAFELLSDTPGVAPPRKIGRFHILRALGEGGTSEVYLAFDPNLKRLVALKVLTSGSVESGGKQAHIQIEAQSLAQLVHKHVVQVFELGEEDGTAFVAMEYVSGTDLSQVIQALRKTEDSPPADIERAVRALGTVADRCRVVAQIAHALSYCHERGIIHRDIKPANVLLAAPAEPKIIDFGLAHLEVDESSLNITQGLAGTPAYMAPEQIDNNKTGASAQSDIFSLGLLFYELLTLEHPFRRASYSATIAEISRAAPIPPRRKQPGIPFDVERICLHALERRPQDRYASAADFAADLDAFLGHRAISLQAPFVLHTARLWLQRNRRYVAAFCALSLLLLVPALWDLRQTRAELTDSIEVLASQVSNLAQAEPEQFEKLFGDLSDLQQRANDYDASLLAGSLFPAGGPQVAELWTSGRNTLHSRILAEQASMLGDPNAIPRDQRRARARAIYETWRYAERLRASLDPSGAQHALVRGSLSLPTGFKLARMKFVDCLVRFEPQPVETLEGLEAGYYRVTGELEGTPVEADFLLSGFELQYRPPLRVPFKSPASSWVPIGAQTLELSDCEVEVQPFEISRRAVTWKQLEEVLDPDTYPAVARHRATAWVEGAAPSAPGDPAIVPWSYALEYAQRVGARIPTAAELLAASELGHLDPDLQSLTGHWSSVNEAEVFALSHAETLAGQFVSASLLLGMPTNSLNEGICFRIARSLP